MASKQMTKCVACGYPIPIDYDDPCPSCGRKKPRYNVVGIHDEGHAKEFIEIGKYGIFWDLNKPLLGITLFLGIFSIVLSVPILSNSVISPYISGWNATFINIILYVITTILGFKAVTRVERIK